jgi:hypothetical protein
VRKGEKGCESGYNNGNKVILHFVGLLGFVVGIFDGNDYWLIDGS